MKPHVWPFLKRPFIAICLVTVFVLIAQSTVPLVINTRLIDPVKNYQLRNEDLDPKNIPNETLGDYINRIYGEKDGQSIDWQIRKHQNLAEIWVLITPGQTDKAPSMLKWSRTYGTLPIIRSLNKRASAITPELYDQALQGELPE